ncbi:hypothetical protein BJ170DRAFT_222673 [Xylariales sp. AK1849]|nr:hypothetical protein BJ170DRAFT_222673 [Xylariales sp. AK1849]
MADHHHTTNSKDVKPENSPYPYTSTDSHSSSAPYESAKNDVFQEQSPPPAQRQRQHVLRFWSWEVLSLAVAIGLVAATVAILAHFDRQELPEWPFSINLNTLIALLSTILRAAMLVAVAEVLGQLKWSYFSRPRPLKHLHDYDRASRSVNGSIKLLFVAPKNFLTVIAALITILSLAIGPFTQQAIKSVPCQQVVKNVNASLPLAHYMPGRADYYRIGAGLWEVEVDMKGSMINGLTNPMGNDSAIVANCQTGNCTFQAYSDDITHSSIGMCSACIDTTPLVTGNENGTNYTLPNDLWLGPMSGSAYLNVMVDQNLTWADSEFYDGFAELAKDALTNVTILSMTNAPCRNNSQSVLECPHNVTGYSGVSDYVATSCSLYPCLKNYHAYMAKGVLNERTVSTVPAPLNRVEANITDGGFSASANYTALKSPCVVDDVEYDKADFDKIPRSNHTFAGINVDGTNYTAPDECLYKLLWLYGEALSSFMDSTLFTGTCTYDSRQGGSLWCGDAWWLSPLYSSRNASYEKISNQVEQYATALTNKFRTSGSDNYNASVVEAALGSVSQTTVCTKFDWRWLLLPACLVAATAALLVMMVIQNYTEPRQPVWKSSILPLLFHGFGSSPEMGPRPVMDLHQMHDQARQVQAKFHNGLDAGLVDVTGVGGRTARDIDMDSLMGDR